MIYSLKGDIMASKEKIEIELSSKRVKQLEIISKAFGKSINWLIEKNLKIDLKYMLQFTNEEDLNELEYYFKTPIVNKEIMTKIRR